MDKELNIYLNKMINKKITSKEFFKLKNLLRELIKSDYEFTPDEYCILYNRPIFYNEIKCIKPNKEYFVAVLNDLGRLLGTESFIKKLCNEDENLIYQIYEKVKYFPVYLREYITADHFYKRISKAASDVDIYHAAFDAGYFDNPRSKRFKEIRNNKKILKSIYDGKNARFHLIEDNSIDVAREDLKKQDKLINNILNKDLKITNSNDIVLINENTSLPSNINEFNVSEYDYKKNGYIFHYISDLHLTHKVLKLYEKGLDIIEAKSKVIDKAVNDILESEDIINHSLTGNYSSNVLLLSGDTSYDIDIVELFFAKLRDGHSFSKIYYVLGNHELWDGDPKGINHHDLNFIIDNYKKRLKKYDVTILNNEVCISVDDVGDLIYSYDDFKNENTLVDIKNALNCCEYVIYGGVGFAGKNEIHNYKEGLYRNLSINRELEKKLSKDHSDLFNLLLSIYNNQIICLTHMPAEDWLDNNFPISNCIFVAGHTHQNQFIQDENNGTYYYDNQIGYKNNTYHTRQFIVNIDVDYLNNYPDGIHYIHQIDYMTFMKYRRNPSNSINSILKDDIILISKDGFKMFVSSNKKGELSILNGGAKKKLSNKDIHYYYDNISKIVDKYLSSFDKYNYYIKELSKTIKSLGGTGYTHGCIVDIDSFHNKIYVNPYDGTITPYVAPELYSSKRIIFSNISNLLTNTPIKTDNINNMNNKLLDTKQTYPLIVANKVPVNEIYTKSTSKDFRQAYSVSRIVKKIQSLFDDNVLKEWDDSLIS